MTSLLAVCFAALTALTLTIAAPQSDQTSQTSQPPGFTATQVADRVADATQVSRTTQRPPLPPKPAKATTPTPPPPEPAPEPATAPAAPAPSGGNRALGHDMMLTAGYAEDQWPCLDALWTRESGWGTYAANPSSGAYGIPQALPGSKMATAGADWQTNPATQIQWGLSYIRSRYGSPCGAWSHSQTYGWY